MSTRLPHTTLTQHGSDGSSGSAKRHDKVYLEPDVHQILYDDNDRGYADLRSIGAWARLHCPQDHLKSGLLGSDRRQEIDSSGTGLHREWYEDLSKPYSMRENPDQGIRVCLDSHADPPPPHDPRLAIYVDSTSSKGSSLSSPSLCTRIMRSDGTRSDFQATKSLSGASVAETTVAFPPIETSERDQGTLTARQDIQPPATPSTRSSTCEEGSEQLRCGVHELSFTSPKDLKRHMLGNSHPESRVQISCPSCDRLHVYRIDNFGRHLSKSHAWDPEKVKEYQQYLRDYQSQYGDCRIIPPRPEPSTPFDAGQEACSSSQNTANDIRPAERNSNVGVSGPTAHGDDMSSIERIPGPLFQDFLNRVAETLASLYVTEHHQNDSENAMSYACDGEVPSKQSTNDSPMDGSDRDLRPGLTANGKMRASNKRKRREDDEPKRNRKQDRSTVASASNAGKKLLACPLFKKDEVKYAACGQKVLWNITLVKHHLKRGCREHDTPIHCDQCWRTFQSQNDMLAHVQLSSCAPSSHPPWIGLTRNQRDAIDLPFTEKGDEKQWFELWNNLGLGYPLPSSPYLPDKNPIDITHLQQFVSDYGPQIHDQVLQNVSFPDDYRHFDQTYRDYQQVFIQQAVITALAFIQNRDPIAPVSLHHSTIDHTNGGIQHGTGSTYSNGHGHASSVQYQFQNAHLQQMPAEATIPQVQSSLGQQASADSMQSLVLTLNDTGLYSDIPVPSLYQDRASLSSMTSSIDFARHSPALPRPDDSAQYPLLQTEYFDFQGQEPNYRDALANSQETLTAFAPEMITGASEKQEEMEFDPGAFADLAELTEFLHEEGTI